MQRVVLAVIGDAVLGPNRPRSSPSVTWSEATRSPAGSPKGRSPWKRRCRWSR